MTSSKGLWSVRRALRRVALLMPILGAVSAFAQQRPESEAANNQRNEVSFGYRYITANNSGGGFRLNGWYLSETRVIQGWLGIVAEASQTHASDIDGVGDKFKLETLSTGPRATAFRGPLQIYAQALLGIAHGNESYAPGSKSFNTTASTYAATIGMGADLRLNRWLSGRLLQVQYLRTGFANEGTETQQHFTVDSGLVIRFDKHRRKPEVAFAEPEFDEIFFSCGTENAVVQEGQTLEILGHASTAPDAIALQYSWKTTGGSIVGDGRDIHLDTRGLRAGEYTVHGWASLVSSPSTSRECNVSFRVLPGISPESVNREAR